MDQMEEVLIDCDVIDCDVIVNGAQPSTSKASEPSSRKVAAKSEEFPLGYISSARVHRGLGRQVLSDTGLTDGAVTSAIMMYSPDIPSAEGRHAYDTKPNLANYYTMIETEETVKCVISTILFFAIVMAIILVAFLENPMM